jgi:hypothetical protein
MLWHRAPELPLGARECSAAVDLWALRPVTFQVATGKVLFAGDSDYGQFRTI